MLIMKLDGTASEGDNRTAIRYKLNNVTKKRPVLV